MKWFRFYSEALDDPKVQRLPAELFKFWVNMLCLASRLDGPLPSEEDAAFGLRMGVSEYRATLAELDRLGFFDHDDGETVPHNWAKRQYASDNSTARVHKHRSRNGDSINEGTLPEQPADRFSNGQRNVSAAVSVTPPDTDTDTDTDTDPSSVAEPAAATASAAPTTPEMVALVKAVRSLPGWPKDLALAKVREKLTDWQARFPEIDLPEEVPRMDSWLLSQRNRKANPQFIENWLKRCGSAPAWTQNGAGNGQNIGASARNGAGAPRPDREVRAGVGLAGRAGADGGRPGDYWDTPPDELRRVLGNRLGQPTGAEPESERADLPSSALP